MATGAEHPAGTRGSGEQVWEIQPVSRRWLPDLAELWRYRALVGLFAMRDLRARYKQTAFGPLWIVLGPLTSTLLYTLLLGSVARLPSGGQPYLLFTFSALLVWNLFTSSASACADTFLTNRALIDKVYFPRLALPSAKLLSLLPDFGVNLVLLVVGCLLFGIRPGWTLLLIPLPLFGAMTMGAGLGLLLTGPVALFRDMLQLLSIGLRLWMYATPVVYSRELVPERWLALYQINPMTPIIETFRGCVLPGLGLPPVGLLAAAIGVGLLVLAAGLRAFHLAEPRVIDIA